MGKIGFVVPLILAALLSTQMIGCAGLGIKAETYRIDEMKSDQRTYNKPLKCLFVTCGGEETHGS